MRKRKAKFAVVCSGIEWRLTWQPQTGSLVARKKHSRHYTEITGKALVEIIQGQLMLL